MKLSRTKNAFRNTFWGAVYRLLAIVGPFVIKTIIIKNLIIVVTGSIVITLAISPPSSAAEKYSMSYLYGGTQSQQTQYIQNTQQSINTISPSYFDINSNGELIINSFSKSFIIFSSLRLSGRIISSVSFSGYIINIFLFLFSLVIFI